MIDPSTPLFPPQLFTKSLDFIDRHISTRKVLIHCNYGLSRAPSIALLYLAKRTKAINAQSYETALQDFIKRFPNYHPGSGIKLYLKTSWNDLNLNTEMINVLKF